jgi:RNA polymerase sigma factor for flagellar operon FliA
MGGTRDQNDRATEEQLVRDHLPLVHYVVAEVAQHVPSYVSRDDLVSAGMAGLAQAARSFDPERGVRFDRYASRRIRGSVLDELRGRDWATRSVRARDRELRSATEELAGSLGRTPTSAELASHLGWTTDEVDELAERVHRAAVVNYEALYDEGTAEDLLPTADDEPDTLLLDRERNAYLVDAVATLPERLRRVVVGYFFEERSMHELGAELGVTDSRISQMRAEALSLLRDGLNSQLQPEAVSGDSRPGGRVARRRHAYYEAIANRRGTRDRIARPASLGELLPAG